MPSVKHFVKVNSRTLGVVVRTSEASAFTAYEINELNCVVRVSIYDPTHFKLSTRELLTIDDINDAISAVKQIQGLNNDKRSKSAF